MRWKEGVTSNAQRKTILSETKARERQRQRDSGRQIDR